MKKPTLTVIGQVPQPRSDLKPPRPLGVHGAANWAAIQNHWHPNSGGTELPTQICLAIDRLDQVAALIAQDGWTIRSRGGVRANPLLREELALRSSFIVRGLQRLGVTRQPVRAEGRPGMVTNWTPA